MKLDEWVDSRGPGAAHQLSIASGVAYTTVAHVIDDSRNGKPNARIDVARKLSDGTRKVSGSDEAPVSVAELRLPDDELVRIGLRAAEGVRAKRKRSAA